MGKWSIPALKKSSDKSTRRAKSPRTRLQPLEEASILQWREQGSPEEDKSSFSRFLSMGFSGASVTSEQRPNRRTRTFSKSDSLQKAHPPSSTIQLASSDDETASIDEDKPKESFSKRTIPQVNFACPPSTSKGSKTPESTDTFPSDNDSVLARKQATTGIVKNIYRVQEDSIESLPIMTPKKISNNLFSPKRLPYRCDPDEKSEPKTSSLPLDLQATILGTPSSHASSTPPPRRAKRQRAVNHDSLSSIVQDAARPRADDDSDLHRAKTAPDDSALLRSFVEGVESETQTTGSFCLTKANNKKRGPRHKKPTKITPGASLTNLKTPPCRYSSVLDDDQEWTPTRAAKTRRHESPAETIASSASRSTRSSTRKQSKLKRQSQPDEVIEIADSDSEEEDTEIQSLDFDLSRIAIGSLVKICDCSAILDTIEKRLILQWRTKRRSNKSSLVQLDLTDTTVQECAYYAPPQHMDIPGPSPLRKCFLCLRVFPTVNNGLSKMGYYDWESRDYRERFIILEFRHFDDLSLIVQNLEGVPGLKVTTIPSSGASLYGEALISHKSSYHPNPYVGQRPDYLLLVYPFAGDPDKIEAAAEGLTEASGALEVGEDNDDSSVASNNVAQASATTTVTSDGSKTRHRAHFVTLRVEDYLRLEPREWLNDSLVDFWMQWISRDNPATSSPFHFFTSHFYSTLEDKGPEAVASWTERKKISLFQKKLIFIPINKDLHWSLCVVVNPGAIGELYNKKENKDSPLSCMIFLDSLRMHNKKKVGANIRCWLNNEWRRAQKKLTGFDVDEKPFQQDYFRMFNPKVPYQDNTWDCGVFVCRYAYALYELRNRNFTFEDAGMYCDRSSRSTSRSAFYDLISDSAEFQFGMDDIARFRDEFKMLIERLSEVYMSFKRSEQRRNAEKPIKDAVEETNEADEKVESTPATFLVGNPDTAEPMEVDDAMDTSDGSVTPNLQDTSPRCAAYPIRVSCSGGLVGLCAHSHKITMDGVEKATSPETIPKVPVVDSDDEDDVKDQKPTIEEVVKHHEQFNIREVVIYLPGGSQIRFNPFASFWCMIDPENANTTLVVWKGRISELFTWFYIGTNPAFMFFVIWLAFRYGNVRLGPPDSKPDFDDVTYFAMLFSAGIGAGLFFYGVSEPLFHRESHWFANSGYRSQDELDMFAVNLTVFHWGITGWTQYLVVALCAGLAAFRYNLPLTLRSCLYPLIGEYAWGWIGDIADGYTIVTTVAGVCTDLGVGAIQLAAGLKVVGAIDSDISDDNMQTVYVVSIWVITLIATVSVVSGLDVGIKFLSRFGMGMSMVITFLVFIMDKSNYILNLIVQETGYYFQWSMILLNFHTDTFGQLKENEGRATDGKSAEVWWMDAWTIFYIGWWVAWAAFVGLFIARISRGRTIRSIIINSYMAPFGYTLVWFCVFGGTGIRQARQAVELQNLGETYFNSSEHYLAEGSTYCYDVPQEDVVVDGATVFTNYLVGVTPVCEFNADEYDMAWFNVMKSFSFPNDFDTGFGPFLCWFSLFALTTYFITSSDAGSLVVDNLASNGFEETHWIQRVFWALTLGAVTTALLVAGGSEALFALQAASILSGLPFTLFLVFMCFSIARMCSLADSSDKSGVEVSLQDFYHSGKKFRTPIFGGVFNAFEVMFSLGDVHPVRLQNMPAPRAQTFINFLVATFAPFVPLFKIYSAVSPKESSKTSNMAATAMYTVSFLLWIVLFGCMGGVSRGLRAFAWCFVLFNGCLLSTLRSKCLRIICNFAISTMDANSPFDSLGNFRAKHGIEGNLVADFAYSIALWPQVLVQMVEELEVVPEKEDVDV
eukprot:Nitzschia sp. Nitz4//scaffold80_size88189//71589//78338//NITZ4_005093-RA/size88189-processed-gene-0.64-mRNA-1//1//CDS//3329558648//2048//frame0